MSNLKDKTAAAAVAVVELPGELSILNLIAEAARDPGIDVDKLDRLLAMQREIIADERKIAFFRAMRAAQAEMRPVVSDAENTHTRSRYARLEAIDRVIKPIYTKHGFSVTCDAEPIPNGVRIWCEVAHDGGYSKVINLEAPLDTGGFKGNDNKTPIQGLGSAVTYLRRYTKLMAFDVAVTDDDNDGNKVDTGEVISPAQHAHLSRLIVDTRTSIPAFLKHVVPGVERLSDIRAADFDKCVTALETKKRVLAERQLETV